MNRTPTNHSRKPLVMETHYPVMETHHPLMETHYHLWKPLEKQGIIICGNHF
jgi:hypothetical protein